MIFIPDFLGKSLGIGLGLALPKKPNKNPKKATFIFENELLGKISNFTQGLCQKIGLSISYSTFPVEICSLFPVLKWLHGRAA